ncbi:MAG: T9SS type A sorting domain-containing protein [Bacteroidota bacterium]
MRLIRIIITLLFTTNVLIGQSHYNVAFDTNYISAIMQENIIINGSLYGVGGAICSTGECGYLTKYSLIGERYWTIEYPQIDINSSQVMHYREGRIYITGRAKDSIATKTLVLDTLGQVLEDWNYSVEGATTNFSKEVYYDEDYYYFILTEEVDGDTRGALYKCDYMGNLVGRVVFPSLVFTIPISVRPYRDNLLISINHRFEESCPFGLNGVSPGATYLAEIDKDSMSILRDKKDVCYQRISSDTYTSPSSEIIRTIILSDTMPKDNEGNLGVIFYTDLWNVKKIIEYPHELAKGISNIKYTNDGQHYFVTIGENVPQTDGSNWPFGDLLLQKWTDDHTMLWEKRFFSHKRLKRLYVQNFEFSENGDIHIVGYVWPDFPFTQNFDFWLFSVDSNGCHNGDCSEVVDLDQTVNTLDPLPVQSSAVAYPNPVHDVLHLQNVSDGVPIQVLNTLGQIKIETLYEIKHGINMRQLESGVYYIKVNGQKSISILKQ